MPGYLCITHPFATLHRSEAFDLHVLGTPPAFILSQDQTLHCPSISSDNLLVCLALFYFLNLIDVVFYSFLFSFQCPLTWLSRRVPIYITILSPFCKAFSCSFFIFSLFLSFSAFISLFFYLYFFVMIKRNDLYRTFLCLMTIWFLYCPEWLLLVHHWSVRLSSSLQRFLFLYGPLHFLMLY